MQLSVVQNVHFMLMCVVVGTGSCVMSPYRQFLGCSEQLMHVAAGGVQILEA